MSTAPSPLARFESWFSGVGRLLALIGLLIVIVLLVVGKLTFLPLGLLFGLAFLAILL